MSKRQYPDTSATQKVIFKSTFLTEGVPCAASLHVPSHAVNQQSPAILIVGGWGSVQRGITDSFIDRFVDQGYAVMEFDYPGWGLSGGLPRQAINPWQRVKTVHNALAHLKNLAQVDGHQIVLWGTSFGGGHVVDVVADYPDLKGAIIQVPMLDGLSTVRAVPVRQMLQFLVYGLADCFTPGRRICIPTVAEKGKLGAMDRDEAWHALQLGLEHAQLKYDNRVTARSLFTMGFYRPWKRLKHVQVPMLIVGATQDTVAPFVVDKIKKVNNPLLQVVEMQANHFDPYFEPYFSENMQYQMAFLKQLK